MDEGEWSVISHPEPRRQRELAHETCWSWCSIDHYLKHFASDVAAATSFWRSAGVKSGPADGAAVPLRDTWITPKVPVAETTGADINF